MEIGEKGKKAQGMVRTSMKADEARRSLLASIIDSCEDAIISETPEGVITSWNPSAERMFGYEAQEIIGKHISLLEPPDRQGEMAGILAKIRNREPVERYETRRRRKDGSLIYVSLTVSPIHDANGRLIGFSSLKRDITKRKLEEIRYRRVLETTGDGILILNADTGEIIDVNPLLLELLGYSGEDFQGKKLWDIGALTDVAASKASFMELQQKGHLRYEDLPLLTKDGRRIYVEFISYLYPTDGTKLIQCNIRDISARKRAQESLAISEKRYRRLLETAKDGILILEANSGEIIDVSPFLVELLGYTGGELLGKKLWEIGSFKDIAASSAAFSELQQQGYIRYEDLPLETKGGQLIDVEFVSKVYELGPKTVIQCNIRDITEGKQAQQEIARLNADLASLAAELENVTRELEAFNYAVAHDLRTPLTAVNGYCQVMQEMCGDKLDEQCKGYLQEAYEGTWRMNRLIDTLLNFSCLTRVEPKRGMVALDKLAHEVATELQLAEPERRAEFRIAAGITVDGDANLLRMVLENLLGNAWKYTAKKQEQIIELGVKKVDGEPAFFVRDNGAGFDMADAAKLFIAFQRLPGAEEFKGIGIGLATVERIIRRHGGKVWAEGNPGKGATFYFTLPADAVSREANE